jgi:hypothetical protein
MLTLDKIIFRYKDVSLQYHQQGFIAGCIMQDELFEGVQPRVFVTNPNNLEEGRTFVWAKARWYERLEGEMGNVAFSPVTDSEEELRSWLTQESGLEATEVDELDSEYAETVREEFLDQTPLYPEAPELSDEPPPRGP